MTRLVEFALWYAAMSWPVFPCRPHGKEPVIPKSEGGNGLHDATLDPKQISEWWYRYPQANIGLRTGIAFDVCDVDGLDGLDALALVMPDGCQPLTGPMVVTGRGYHHYVQPTGHGNKTGLVAHVDWRGKGGYVIAPPSVHPSGQRYRWAFGEPGPLLQCPAWLSKLLDPPPIVRSPSSATGSPTPGDAYARRALESEVGRLAVASAGQRNKQLHLAAVRCGQLVAARQLDIVEVVGALSSVAQRIGLSDREIAGTVDSGLRYGIDNPR